MTQGEDRIVLFLMTNLMWFPAVPPGSRRQRESGGPACGWETGQGQEAAKGTGDFSSWSPVLINQDAASHHSLHLLTPNESE